MKKNRLWLFFSILTFLLISGNACTKKTPPAPEDSQKEAAAPAPKEASPAKPGDCTYSTDPNDIKVQWTAYKFTKKTAVKGTFIQRKVNGPNSAKSLGDLAIGLSMDIDGASIESGDPGRNVTIKQFFFGEFNPPFKMSAKVAGFMGSDTGGNLQISINMNGVTKTLPFAYSVTPDGKFEAKSGFDMNSFNLSGPFNSIHDACETLHTGEDGVSKTWPDVDLLITAKFKKECA